MMLAQRVTPQGAVKAYVPLERPCCNLQQSRDSQSGQSDGDGKRRRFFVAYPPEFPAVRTIQEFPSLLSPSPVAPIPTIKTAPESLGAALEAEHATR